MDQCLEEMSECFFKAHEEIGEINFTAVAVETSPQFAMITTEVAPCHVSKFLFDIGEAGYGGRMDFVLPIPMLSPIRRFLEQSFKGDRRGDDFIWKQSLSMLLPSTLLHYKQKLKQPISLLMIFTTGKQVTLLI